MMTGNENQLLRNLRFQSIVTRAMLGALDLDQVFHVILSGIIHPGGLDFNRVFLFLADEASRELRVYSVLGPADEAEAQSTSNRLKDQQFDLDRVLLDYERAGENPKARALAQRLAGFAVPLSASAVSISEGDVGVPLQALVARCAALKDALVFNAIQFEFQPPPAGGRKVLTFSNVAVVPLILKESVAGVILADNTLNNREVRNEDLQGLINVGNLAAIAIDSSQLRQRLKEMSALDGLTSVFNRRHFELRLQQEILQARRAGRPLSMLLFDIDRFKAFNETRGPDCGDQVLKDLATLLRDRVRAGDMVARYGDAQFGVLLTGGATAEEAIRVAEKLRQEIAGRSMGGAPAGEITVSVGVASQPPDRLDGGKLLQFADRALVQAKRKGRNCVVDVANG